MATLRLKAVTLLLDDPIQHLDDLDAIAFLDTLRAVALGRFGRRRQIVISTCDRNLFQLMIQKFQPLEAVGASFSAITLVERGSAGPFVRQQSPRSVDPSSRSA
jgi:exonuclease SbcC